MPSPNTLTNKIYNVMISLTLNVKQNAHFNRKPIKQAKIVKTGEKNKLYQFIVKRKYGNKTKNERRLL